MRIAYAGTPEFAVPALDGLIQAGVDIVGVWTQPDRPAGRGRKLTPSPVKQLALQAGLAVHEYAPRLIKQAIVGRGGADKEQVQHMVRVLLKSTDSFGADAADALAVALCHAVHSRARAAWRHFSTTFMALARMVSE